MGNKYSNIGVIKIPKEIPLPLTKEILNSLPADLINKIICCAINNNKIEIKSKEEILYYINYSLRAASLVNFWRFLSGY